MKSGGGEGEVRLRSRHQKRPLASFFPTGLWPVVGVTGVDLGSCGAGNLRLQINWRACRVWGEADPALSWVGLSHERETDRRPPQPSLLG